MKGLSREEILARAKKDNNNNEFENRSFFRGVVLAFAVQMIVAVIIVFAQIFSKAKPSVELFALVFIGLTVSYTYEGIKTSSKKKMLFGVICGVLALIFLVGLIAG